MFEKEATEYADERSRKLNIDKASLTYSCMKIGYQKGTIDGYNKAKEEQKGKCKTAYIKGIRTMANALKDYDRTNGAWTDYFEHSVEEVLKRLLKESE